MELSTYFNYDTFLQNPISEICTNNINNNNSNFIIEPTPEELVQEYYFNQNNNLYPYSDESFLDNPNTFLEPYFCSDPNYDFLCPEITPHHTAASSDYSDDNQLLNFTPFDDPFIISINDIFQTDKNDCFNSNNNNNINTLLPCPKRQKIFHEEHNQNELIADEFVLNHPCTLPQAEELLYSASVPQFIPQQGCEFAAGSGEFQCGGEKKGNEERGISAQSIAARERRRRITEKTQELGKLVPGGPKMNTAEMLNAASKYVKYLQAQVGMLQLINTLKEEDKEVSACEDNLQALVASTIVQEKLYSEEMCFVPKEFITTLANHDDVQSRPNIIKDLKQLIGTDTEKKNKAKQD